MCKIWLADGEFLTRNVNKHEMFNFESDKASRWLAGTEKDFTRCLASYGESSDIHFLPVQCIWSRSGPHINSNYNINIDRNNSIHNTFEQLIYITDHRKNSKISHETSPSNEQMTF